MELTFGIRELTATCNGSVLKLEQGEDGIVEVFLDGETRGTISLSDE